jgi:High-temperature-induced dauer-formation protein
MGAVESKAQFKEALNTLSTENLSRDNSEFWTRLWRTPTTAVVRDQLTACSLQTSIAFSIINNCLQIISIMSFFFALIVVHSKYP